MWFLPSSLTDGQLEEQKFNSMSRTLISAPVAANLCTLFYSLCKNSLCPTLKVLLIFKQIGFTLVKNWGSLGIACVKQGMGQWAQNWDTPG